MNEVVVLCRVLVFDAVEKGVRLALDGSVLADDPIVRHELRITPPQRRHIQNRAKLFFRLVQTPILRDTVCTTVKKKFFQSAPQSKNVVKQKNVVKHLAIQ